MIAVSKPLMKPALPTLFWLSLAAGAFAADDTPINPSVPQPRPRLVQTVAGATPQVEPAAPQATPPTFVMTKFVVRESPVPGGVPQPLSPEPKAFSFLNGGPLYTGKLGSLPFEAGVWTPIDIMPETAKFRPQKTQVEFDFLRLKF